MLETVFLIIDIIALVLLLWFILFGFVRGWKKSMLNTIAFLLPFTIIVIMSSKLAHILLDVNFFGKGSIQGGIIALVESIVTKQGGFSNDTVIIVDGFVIAILKWIIYGLAFLVAWLISLIIKLIFKLTLKKFIYGEDGRKRSPRFKERLLGLAMGAIRGFIMVFLFFGPTMGLINLTDMIIQDIPIVQQVTDTDDGAQYMSQQSHILEEIHQDINSSYTYNILNIGKGSDSGIGLSGRCFGSLFAIEINDSKISLIKEYGYLRQIFPVVNKIIETNDNKENIITLSNLTDNDIKVINDLINHSTVIDVAAPLLLDLTCNLLENEDAQGNEEVINLLRTLDLEKELDVYGDFINEMFVKFHYVEINLNNPEDILLEEDLAENANEVFDILLRSELFTNLAIPSISESIMKSIEEDELKELFSEESIKEFLSKDVEALLKIYQSLNKNNNLHNFIFHSEEFDYSSPEAISSIDDALTKLFNLTIISGNEDMLIRYLLNIMDYEKLDYDILFKDVNVNWKEETKIISSIICEILSLKEQINFDEGSFVDKCIQKNDDGEYVIKGLIEEIAKSKLLITALVNVISEFKEDEEFGEIINLFNFEVIKTSESESIINEFDRLLNIIDLLNQMNLIGDEEFIFDIDLVKEVILLIFDSKLIEGNENKIIEYIINTTGLNEILNEYNVAINYDNINWDEEPERLVDVFVAITNFGDFSEFDFNVFFGENIKENQEKIINLIEALDNSQLFSPSLESLINTLLGQTEYEINITEEDFLQIRENTWRKEITNLVEVIEYCRNTIDNTSDSNSIKGEDITNIMLKASETVIATKILGTALNELLGADGLNLNPLLQDGTYKYDFRNAQILKDVATDIGSLVDLKNATSDFDISDITSSDQNIEVIIDSFTNLGSSDIINDMVNEYLGEDVEVDLSGMDTEKEAEIIEDVYEIYKENPDEFNLDEHPELKEKVEESELVDAMLKLLGITNN